MKTKEEIQFNKYEKRGKDYHYKQINLKNPFSFNAYVYARYIKHIELLKKILQEKNINKSQNLNLLDLGCGDGVLLFLIKKYIQDYKFNFYGIDLSEIALETAKDKVIDGNFSKSGVYETDFQNNFFDIILSSDVIEHINFPDKMLHEAKRIAKSDAIIIFGTPIRYTESPIDKMHVKEFFPNEFKQIFERYFNKVNITRSHKLFYLLKYQKQSKLFWKKISINKYNYYFLSLLSKNPFLDQEEKANELYTYMFVVGTKYNYK
ncbi:MAG: class I SAM-dependent methyltransferase [Bacteroidales bacterium]|nr:class I SAM-dependent methyltransferase [Bacteroidales bacterium]